ncbi:metallopeptidase [Podospora fimiseda]|uniref:Metallopeptidase n=1 Tax=Podospora fimiseda TaxID=252190 RepID=A0AAN7BHF9_9PEZI|nr:metallopeptidase [Podospora fimiseda]
MFELFNFVLSDGKVEDVYQRSLIVSGRCTSKAALDKTDGYVTVDTSDQSDNQTFPSQRWPMCNGYFKALVLLSPGLNKVIVTSGYDVEDKIEIPLRYTPLLQTPPLHLAILIAKDSPLLIDCPPAKFGAISSTHSTLDAAIAKFRVAAYMWQAQTAEDLRSKGLGRRSFRLEEEWSVDTLTERSLHSRNKTAMNLVPRIHLVRTKKMVAQLRDLEMAQQNPRGQRRDELHEGFTKALQAHGHPFTSDASPVVAGLILDSHYDLDAKMIVAHAALGAHNPAGLSLGIFGSHTTYSWPRFLEEIPHCLLDTTRPGDTVGNDNKECNTMWETCAVGQGAFLHEVGHAFSAPHTTGIMERGYSPDWPKVFLSRTGYSLTHNTDGLEPVTPETPNDCVWDLRDALRFRNLAHFWLPGDVRLDPKAPILRLTAETDGMEIFCEAGIVEIRQGFDTDNLRESLSHEMAMKLFSAVPSVEKPVTCLSISRETFHELFDSQKPLSFEFVSLNGKHLFIKNIWTALRSPGIIRIPGSDIKLVISTVDSGIEQDNDSRWGVMLNKRKRNGKLVRASTIDIRVGCWLDGAIVYYKDGTAIPCGPRSPHGHPEHYMGGHQHRKLKISKGVDIVKVAVTKPTCSDYLQGLRMWLSNGQAMGALNVRSGNVEYLVPPPGHKIVGFVGRSTSDVSCTAFGIVSAPLGIELPDAMYDIEELQNNPQGRSSKKRKFNPQPRDDESDSDTAMCDDSGDDSEGLDLDDGYDDGWNEETEAIYERHGTH